MIHWHGLDRTTKFFTILAAIAHVVAIVGVALHGLSFLIEPIPLPHVATRFWLNINAVLALLCGFYVARNLVRYRPHWTWQEIQLSRGLFFVLFGGGVAYFARSLIAEPVVTFGTPFVTLGCLLIINATVARPERFHQ